jgi:hypothetical protein
MACRWPQSLIVAEQPRVQTPRPARGKRPQYFDDPALDQLHATLLAVTAELSVLHDRFDLIERVLDDKGVVTRADIEAFPLDERARSERGEHREQLIRRLFRSVSELREKIERD